jgi:phosphoribosylglycinamide formyltransferase 1
MTSFPIAVLISGGGTTLKNLLEWQRLGELDVKFSVVVCSNPQAKGIAIAQEAGIPVHIVSRKNYLDPVAHSDAVFAHCRDHQVQLVVMGGYLEHLLIPEDFKNRVINTHPSLIPAFCGKGFYGERVHQAVYDMGVKLTGCTMHFVDNEYDHGPIIAQRSCPVLEEDTPESIQRRVFELECQLYPEVIDAIARKRISVEGRKVAVRAIV